MLKSKNYCTFSLQFQFSSYVLYKYFSGLVQKSKKLVKVAKVMYSEKAKMSNNHPILILQGKNSDSILELGQAGVFLSTKA